MSARPAAGRRLAPRNLAAAGPSGLGCVSGYATGPAPQRTIARTLLDAGEASGEAFKFARKAMGIRAADLAPVLGVTPETVSRWEADKHAIDRGSWALLGLLAADRAAGTWTTENALKAAAKARPLAPRVELKVA